MVLNVSEGSWGSRPVGVVSAQVALGTKSLIIPMFRLEDLSRSYLMLVVDEPRLSIMGCGVACSV